MARAPTKSAKRGLRLPLVGSDAGTRAAGRAAAATAKATARASAAKRAAKPRPEPITVPKASPVTVRQGRRRLVVLVALTLFSFGLVMVASASSGSQALNGDAQWGLLQKQATIGIVGLVAMWIGMRLPLELVRRLARPVTWACAALVAVVMVPGVGSTVNGATRWIDLGFFQLQPSEPLKLAIVALLADHLSRTRPPVHWMRDLVKSPGGVALGLAGAVVALHSDLGSALVIGASTVVIYVLAGTSWRLLARTISPILALVALSILTEEFRRERFLAFIDPWADPHGPGYQLVQALIAIGSGGPFGVGLGHSVQKIHFLPEAHTDMIFAIVVEELGLFGVVLVLGSFAVLAAVGTRIAMRARTRFSALLAAGITAMVVGQAAVNIAGVTGVMPLTGIPLPLVSYGGSSLIVTLAALGLLANVATERRPARTFALPEHYHDELDDLDEDSIDYGYEDDDAEPAPQHSGADEPAPAGARRRRWHRGSPGASDRSG